MRPPLIIHVFCLILPIILFTSCKTTHDEAETVGSLNPPASGTGSINHIDVEGGNGFFNYTHDLGDSPKDLYLIVTHASSQQGKTNEILSKSKKISSQDQLLANRNPSRQIFTTDLRQAARDQGIGLRGTPKSIGFSINDHPLHPLKSGHKAQKKEIKPLKSQVGDVDSFANNSALDLVPSTLRKISTDGKVSVNIWVANDAWESCSKQSCMTQEMVDAFAESFLIPGESNDIYDWVTNIFGIPWGPHKYDNLINETAAQSIDILFFDIDNDGNSTDTPVTGGVLGFFWAKDLYNKAQMNYSNERLMFYIDSILTATGEDTWEVTDTWPAEMIITLAHEFQHMIHFYQKTILLEAQSDTEVWINEMLSMVTEDLLADKLKNIGPRGINHEDGSAGEPGNSQGRLPLFVLYNSTSVSEWPYSQEVLKSYAANFAYGAYLARNFGGPVLLRAIVKNAAYDYRAVDLALAELGYNESFVTTLQKWGVANLLSDRTDNAPGYILNTGGYMDFELDGTTYSLGSINLDNFTIGPYSGLQTLPLASLTNGFPANPFSNTTIKAAVSAAGKQTFRINMNNNSKLTAVTRER